MQETSTSNSSQFPTQHREEKNEINASIRIVPMTEIDVELKKITGKSIDNVVSGGAEVYVRKGTYSHLYEEQAVGKSSAKRMAAWLGGMLLVGSAAVSHLYAQQSSGQAEYTGVTVEDKMRLHDQLEARKQERAGKKFMQHIDDLITKGVVYQHVERISFASSESDNKALGVNATSSSVNDYAPILEHVQQQLLQARFDTGLEGKAQLTQVISFYLEHYKAFETASQYTGISPAALLAAAVNANGIPQGPKFFYKGLQGKVAMTYANEEGKTYALSSLYDNVSDSQSLQRLYDGWASFVQSQISFQPGVQAALRNETKFQQAMQGSGKSAVKDIIWSMYYHGVPLEHPKISNGLSYSSVSSTPANTQQIGSASVIIAADALDGYDPSRSENSDNTKSMISILKDMIQRLRSRMKQ